MDRSLAARLGRPLGLTVPGAGSRRHARPAARGAGRARSRSSVGARLIGASAWLGALLRTHRRVRGALLAMLVALPLLGGAWLYFRSSPLVAVEQVQIGGVSGPDARAIDAALATRARRMSTLAVDPGALLAATARFRVVRAVRVHASFPHGLRIEVLEQPPVAALAVGSARTAVAADGTVLGPALLTGSLPSLSGDYLPGAGGRVRNGGLLSSLAVLGAAPAPLVRFIARAYEGPMGLTVAMRGGLLVYFGDASRPHAKWLSLARVLADPSSAGASYVDVRLPERPAAGFPAGVAPPAASASAQAAGEGEQAADERAADSEQSTVAALAAGLSEAGGVGASSSSPEPSSAAGEASGAAGSTGESAVSSAQGGGESAAAQAPPEETGTTGAAQAAEAGAPAGG